MMFWHMTNVSQYIFCARNWKDVRVPVVSDVTASTVKLSQTQNVTSAQSQVKGKDVVTGMSAMTNILCQDELIANNWRLTVAIILFIC